VKKCAWIICIAVVCLSIAVAGDAQQRRSGGGGEDYNYCPYCGSPLGPGEGYGYGMGPGMMGRGYGMGPGMMYPGWGMGRGMMGRGYGPGMMDRGYGPGMMERGWGGYGYRQNEECQKFFNDTIDLRKQLHAKRFEYSEAYRNPKTTSVQLSQLEKEIEDLQNKIADKAPRGCW